VEAGASRLKKGKGQRGTGREKKKKPKKQKEKKKKTRNPRKRLSRRDSEPWRRNQEDAKKSTTPW
jgi:hypothetical protein